MKKIIETNNHSRLQIYNNSMRMAKRLYLTGSVDIEKYLISYLNGHQIYTLCFVNKSIRVIILEITININLLNNLDLKKIYALTKLNKSICHLLPTDVDFHKNVSTYAKYETNNKTRNIIIMAVTYGHVEILDFYAGLFKEEDFHVTMVIIRALMNGHQNIINWLNKFKNIYSNFFISKNDTNINKIIVYLCQIGDCDLLEWIYNKNFYEEYIVEHHDGSTSCEGYNCPGACFDDGPGDCYRYDYKGKWLYNFIKKIINTACKYNQINILIMLKRVTGKDFYRYFKSKNIYKAYANKYYDIVEYFSDHFESIRYLNCVPMIINLASERGDIEYLSQLRNTYGYLDYTKKAIDIACKFKQIDVLDWFYNSGLKFKYGKLARKWMNQPGFENILKWFCDRKFIKKLNN